MKEKFWWLAVLVVIAAGFSRSIPPKRWQYKECYLGDPHDPACNLNALGAQGWELVTATPFAWADGTTSAHVFLKREAS